MAKLKELSAFLLFTIAMMALALATVPSKPYTFVSNTTASSSQVNADFDTLYSTLNAQLDSTNINLSAGIGANFIQSTCGPCSGIFNPGAYTFSPNSTSAVPLTVYGIAAQTGDLWDMFLTSGGTKVDWVTAGGVFHTNSAPVFGGALGVASGGTGSTSFSVNSCTRTNASPVLVSAAGDCVTSVTASSPLASSGGTSPNITCATCVSSVTASGNIASSGGTTPNITFTGVLPVANGGSQCFTATGASCASTYHNVVGSITTTLTAACSANTQCAASGTDFLMSGSAVFSSASSYGCNATVSGTGGAANGNVLVSSNSVTASDASVAIYAMAPQPSGGTFTIHFSCSGT